ncbi:hypothetical protein MJH12_15290, partial [bacterium]|nr:hypothetical protein [bacterium]
FSGVVPQASKLRVSSKNQAYFNLLKKSFGVRGANYSSSKTLSKAISVSNGVYTITESNVAQGYDISLSLRYFDANNQLLTGNNVVNANKLSANLSGYETIDGIKLTYDSFSMDHVKNGNATSTITGSASISASNNTTFTLSMNNLIVSDSTSLITSGSIEMTGSDTTKVVTVTSTFQASGIPVVTVKENNQQISSVSLELASVTVNNGQTVFKSNSAMITHPFIGDILDGNSKSYDTIVSGGGTVLQGTVTVNKTNTIVKVCNVNTRKLYLGLYLNGVTEISEFYIAQDSAGNLYSFGDSDSAIKSCTVIPLDLPNNMTSQSFSWTGTRSDNISFTSTITNIGMTKDGFTNLTEVTSNGGDGSSSKEYYNTTYGSAIFEASDVVDGTQITISIKRKL